MMASSFDVKYFTRNMSFPNNVRRHGVLEVNEAGLTLFDATRSNVVDQLSWDEITVHAPLSGIEHVTITLKQRVLGIWWMTYGIYFSDRTTGIQALAQAMSRYGKDLEPPTAVEHSAKAIVVALLAIIFGATVAGALYFYFAY